MFLVFSSIYHVIGLLDYFKIAFSLSFALSHFFYLIAVAVEKETLYMNLCVCSNFSEAEIITRQSSRDKCSSLIFSKPLIFIILQPSSTFLVVFDWEFLVSVHFVNSELG